jgi:acyl carrier protein
LSVIKDEIKKFLLETVLVGEDPANLTDELPLMNSGILDSLSTLQLVQELESRFGVKIKAFEINIKNLGTLELIEGFVERKQKE